jgi:6-phosphogluconolactonase
MTNHATSTLEVFDDAEALARHTATWLHRLAAAATGRFAVCLSGGSTPRRLYELLAGGDHVGTFPWARVDWFWGDERFVPRDSPRSNFLMVRDAMLAKVPIPAARIHAIPTEGTTPEAAAAAYEQELQRFYGAQTLDPARPLFDVTLLGLGDNGHTASLFPGTPALAERRRWAVPVTSLVPEPRITLTYPALESSRETVFLVAGAEKRAVVASVRAGDPALPASRLRPTGSLRWFVDREATPGETGP